MTAVAAAPACIAAIVDLRKDLKQLQERTNETYGGTLQRLYGCAELSAGASECLRVRSTEAGQSICAASSLSFNGCSCVPEQSTADAGVTPPTDDGGGTTTTDGGTTTTDGGTTTTDGGTTTTDGGSTTTGGGLWDVNNWDQATWN